MKKGTTLLGGLYKGTDYIGEVYKGTQHINSFGFPTTQSGSPVKLTDARAKALLNNTVTGNTQHTITIDGTEYVVPSDITLLEYIETTGTQYINTNIQANPAYTNAKMRVMLTSLTGTTGLFGARDATSSSVKSYNIFENVSGAAGRFDNVNPSYPYVFTADTWYDIALGHDGLKGTVTIDGTLVTTGTQNMENAEVGNIYIGAFNSNGSVFTGAPSKWGAVEIRKDGTNLSALFYPAKQNNIIGMYDFVRGTFFTNAGSGSFTAGSELPIPDYPLGVKGVGDKTENLFNQDTMGESCNGSLSTTGSILVNGTSGTFKMPCEPDTQYVVGFLDELETTIFRVATTESEFVGTRMATLDHYIGTNQKTYTFTTNANAYWMYMQTNSAKFDDVKNALMLVKGSTAPTEYIPYGYKIPIDDNGVIYNAYRNHEFFNCGDYTDEIGVVSGNDIIRCGIKVLDGTESWTDASSGTKHIYYVGIADRKTDGDYKYGFCSHFAFSTATSSRVEDLNMFFYGSTASGFRDDAITSLADWKAYIAAQYAAGTPVTVWYPKATPTAESITPIPVTLGQGTNVIESVNDVKGSMAVEYLKRTN